MRARTRSLRCLCAVMVEFGALLRLEKGPIEGDAQKCDAHADSSFIGTRSRQEYEQNYNQKQKQHRSYGVTDPQTGVGRASTAAKEEQGSNRQTHEKHGHEDEITD